MAPLTFNNRALSKEAWKAQKNRDMVEAMLLSPNLEGPSKIAKPFWATLDRETQHAIIDFLHSAKLRSPFLAKLPPEIRLTIYEYVLDGGTVLPNKLAIPDGLYEPPFLRVCRTFRAEAMKLYCEFLVTLTERNLPGGVFWREMQRNSDTGARNDHVGVQILDWRIVEWLELERWAYSGASKEMRRMVALGYIGTNPPSEAVSEPRFA